MSKPADGIDWQAPSVIQTETGPKGVISSPMGSEEKPCFTCAKWVKDNRRLVQHFIARGLRADENGHFETPIVQDFHDGRRSMKVDPKDWGWCPKLVMPTHMLATCEFWQETNLVREIARKIR